MWRMGYGADSFLTLTMGERVGVAVVSLMIALVLLTLVWRWGGLVRAVGLFWAFVWFAPQIYYLYYIMIFDGLPWQIVVKSPPGPVDMIRLLTFSDRATLSHHGKGVLGWSLIGLALVRVVMRRRAKRAQDRGDTS